MTGLELVALGLLLMTLLPIVYFDITKRTIPDPWIMGLLIAGAGYQIAHRPELATAGHLGLALFGVTAIAVMIGLSARLLKRPSAIGLGDLKFFAAISAWIGFVGATLALAIGAIGAVLWALALSPWQGFDLKREAPLAPFLAIGTLVMFALVSPSP